jgi:hypothetical protein
MKIQLELEDFRKGSNPEWQVHFFHAFNTKVERLSK